MRLRTIGGLLGLCVAFSVLGAEPATGGRIHNLKVLSDRIDDVTTAENILKSFVKPDMPAAERSKAIWRASVKYRHQTSPPNEHLSADWEAHDPVKLFNVYGYCMCCCASSLIESLNRLDGRQARGRILTGHSVPEVFYDDGWHMYDASLLTYFPKPKVGAVASVDDIAQAVTEWYARNPGYKGDSKKLDDLMRSDGWTGWKSKGPELLSNCPFYNLGWFPARTHGWNATMVEYDRKCEVYEYGYQVGHRALFALRPGENIVRSAGNRGLHVNMRQGGSDVLKARAPENDLVYLKEFFPGYTGGVVANGYHRYAPDLSASQLAAGAEVFDNLTAGKAPALRLKEAGKPGVAVIPITSPYVYLGGRVTVAAVRKTKDDRVSVSISTNNGRTFAPLWSAEEVGRSKATIDLKDRVLRRYGYWLKVEIVSANVDGAGLDELSVENDIQHAPRTLPWLGKGTTTLTVAGDADPALATRTVNCRITPDARFDMNETTGTMGAVFDNLNVNDGSCWWKGGTGTLTVPIETPGDLTALRFCAQIRARGDKDLVKMLASFDDGKSWKEAGRIAGPTPGTTQAFVFNQVPQKARKVLFRFELTGNNTVGIFSFRVDADYRDPLASKAVPAFRVVHRWKENGQEKEHAEQVSKLPHKYKIETSADPEMVSVTYEMK